jgi:predicted Holliday junction resolvase-like endonuclease
MSDNDIFAHIKIIQIIHKKTGKSASLTHEQRKIKEVIEEKRVKWETITLQ